MRTFMRLSALAVVLALGASTAPDARAADLLPFLIGNIPSFTAAPLYIAIDKGYYTAAGLDVQLTNAGSPGDQAAALTQNRLQGFGGAVTASFYNSFARKLPVEMILSRAVTPLNHYLMVRMGLKGQLKGPADLKGKTIALDAVGTDLGYELLKTLQSVGLTFNDIHLTYLPFAEEPAALSTGAIDMALMVSPLSDATAEKGLAFRFLGTDKYMNPRPMVASVVEVNRDWVTAHPDAAKAFIQATLKATRYYCDAYHHGPNRADVVRILAKYSNVQDPALIEKINWTSMDPDGRISMPSIMDIQNYYIDQKLVTEPVAAADMAPRPWVEQARAGLPRYKPANDDHQPGCR